MPKELVGKNVVLLVPCFSGVIGSMREVERYGLSHVPGRYEFLIKKETGNGSWPLLNDAFHPWWKLFVPHHLYLKYGLNKDN